MSSIRKLSAPLGKSILIFLSFLSFQSLALSQVQARLYFMDGPRVTDVRQGGLGSCYFHATIASIVNLDPNNISKMIRETGSGTYAVTFPDGKSESVSKEDLEYAALNGFDNSEVLWPNVLFRAYGQRVLRQALVESIAGSTLPATIKIIAARLVESSGPFLSIYDRAIRSQVGQQGEINRDRLKTSLNERLRAFPVSEQTRASLVNLADSQDFLGPIERMLKENGEIFGAYRAIGNGGIPQNVFRSFLAQDVVVVPPRNVANATTGTGSGVAAVAGTSQEAPLYLHDQIADWFVPTHAYTVIGYSPQTRVITLRNPWGRYPGNDGLFEITTDVFESTFQFLIVSNP
jgi:hypothetical protein